MTGLLRRITSVNPSVFFFADAKKNPAPFTQGSHTGLRIKRTNGSKTYSYIYTGSTLTQMTVGADTLYFTYDASGVPLTVTHNGTTYYYATNLQGDIVAILDANGATVVTYTYDAWGNPLSTTGTMAATLGAVNPLRYRGYVYDTETELYHLQSRYYNPEIGRFINADGLTDAGQGLLGANIYAYCGNNSVSYHDPFGNMRTYSVMLTDSGKTSDRYKVHCVFPAKYTVADWKRADFEGKKQMLISYHNDISNLLNVKNNLVFYVKESSNGLRNHGFYSDRTNTVNINTYSIISEGYDVLKVVAHELRHAYQYDAVRKMYILGHPYPPSEDRLTLIIWDYNLNNYISTEEDFNAYWYQPVEVDARYFADQKE